MVALNSSFVLTEFTKPGGGAVQIGTDIQSFAINRFGHVVALSTYGLGGVLTEFTKPARSGLNRYRRYILRH